MNRRDQLALMANQITDEIVDEADGSVPAMLYELVLRLVRQDDRIDELEAKLEALAQERT